MRHHRSAPMFPLAARLLLPILFLPHPESLAVDSASFEAGRGNATQMLRVGLQWDWDRKWFEGENWYLGGYWDLTSARWHGTRYQNVPGQVQNIGDLGITPVFRLQRRDGAGIYFEAAIGLHQLTDRYDNNGRVLSSRFEFGDSLALGYRFARGWEAALKLQHFSNAGFSHPDSGVNFVFLRIAKRFN